MDWGFLLIRSLSKMSQFLLIALGYCDSVEFLQYFFFWTIFSPFSQKISFQMMRDDRAKGCNVWHMSHYYKSIIVCHLIWMGFYMHSSTVFKALAIKVIFYRKTSNIQRQLKFRSLFHRNMSDLMFVAGVRSILKSADRLTSPNGKNQSLPIHFLLRHHSHCLFTRLRNICLSARFNRIEMNVVVYNLTQSPIHLYPGDTYIYISMCLCVFVYTKRITTATHSLAWWANCLNGMETACIQCARIFSSALTKSIKWWISCLFSILIYLYTNADALFLPPRSVHSFLIPCSGNGQYFFPLQIHQLVARSRAFIPLSFIYLADEI